MGAAPPAACPRCPPAPTTSCARRACVGPRPAARASPRCSPSATTSGPSARPSSSWSASRATSSPSSVPAALDNSRRSPAHRRGARRRPRRGPRRGLARRRPRGLRQADRLPRAPAAPVHRPVGAQPHARHPRSRVPWANGTTGTCPNPSAPTPATVRPRRLPPGQHDDGAGRPRPARGHLRLGDGHHRRSAGRPRLPVHPVGRPQRPDRAACSSSRASPARRASLREELVARYEERWDAR